MRWHAVIPFASMICLCGSLFGQTGFSIAPIDSTADPCTNFYQYACGEWIARNPLPGDATRWGRFDELQERNRVVLREILKAAAAAEDRSPLDQKIGDLYAGCMDPEIYNRRSMDQFQRDINRILVVDNKQDLIDIVIYLNRMGAQPFFRFGPEPDFKDSSRMIAGLDQGGIALPDREDYLRSDAASVELRNDYRKHLEQVFQLLGQPEREAGANAASVLRIETALARASLDRVSRRDPEQVYHVMPIDQLDEIAMAFDWFWFLSRSGSPSIDSLNVAVPAFARAFAVIWDNSTLDELKAYLTWTMTHEVTPLIREIFQQARFEFFEQRLLGASQPRPRWKVCVDLVDRVLPDALGQRFLESTLGEEGITRTREMVAGLEAAFAREIESLDWMTGATKAAALEKLDKIANKIAGQEKWLDYADVRIDRRDLYSSVLRAELAELARELAKIGQPVDRSEWYMSQPTANAYYDAQNNDITFPAGILQPPFWDNTMDDAVNYGAVGAVIGHELTHGFDDQGRQFDAVGNLRDWWTAEDEAAFSQRASCIDQQYAAFTPLPGRRINGQLTLGENIADNGGVRIAYRALMDVLGSGEQEEIDGFTPQQRFFLGWGQIWCQNITEDAMRVRLSTDVHSPGEFRVNGVVANMPEFREAFGCTESNASAQELPACRVW